jgi:hypothetical protein
MAAPLKKLTPDLGFGYKGEYKDKQTGEPRGYVKLLIRESEIAKLTANEKGFFEVTLFPTTGPKKSDKTPDVTLKPTIKKAKKDNVTAEATNAASGLPF